MPENTLTIGVRADASKLRGDLAIANAAIRDVKKQLSSAAKEAHVTGARGEVDRLAGEYEKAAAHAGKLQTALKAVGSAHHEATKPLHEVGKALKEVGGLFKEVAHGVGESWAKLKESFSNMGEHLFGEHFKAALALGVGASVAGLYELVHSSAEAADAVEKSAMSLGLGVKAYQELRYAAIKAGVSTDAFATAFARMSRQIEAGAQAQRGALVDVGKMLYGPAMAGGPTVLRGGSQTQEGGATVLRGGGGSGNVAPGFTTVLPDTVAKVKNFARALKTALDQAGVGATFTAGQISQAIATLAESTGRQADQLRAKLREFGVALQPRTIADALDNLSMTWTEKVGQIVNTIDPLTLQIRPLDDIIADLADKFRAMPDGAEKTALAVRLFGRAGAQLIPFLDRGSKGIAKWRQEFERLGIAFDENQTKVGRQAVEAFETLSIAMQGAKNQFALVFDPIFTPLINELTLAIAKNAGTLKSWARDIAGQVQPVIDDLIRMLKGEDSKVKNRWLLQMRDGIEDLAAGLRKAWPTIKQGFVDLRGVLRGVAAALNYVFGTDYSAASIGILLTLGKLTGAFGALRALIGLAGTLLSGLLIAPISGAIRFAATLGLIPAEIDGIAAAAGYLSAALVSSIGGAVGAAVENAVIGLRLLGAQMLEMGKGAALASLAGLRAAFFGLAAGLRAAATASLAFLATPLGLTLAALALVALLVYANWDRIRPLLLELWASMKAIGAWVAGAFKAAWESAVYAIETAWNSLVGWIEHGIVMILGWLKAVLDKAEAVGHAIASFFGGAAGSSLGAAAGGTTAGFARGGLVRGPGSSTSDSIPARLSHGEYVMSARAVSAIGVGMLHALNAARGFALGGLVSLPGRLSEAPLRLAGGGLVGAGAGGHGATINLTVGEHTFRGLSAPDGVAGQMQRYARGRQMTSGGVKPSWYGG